MSSSVHVSLPLYSSYCLWQHFVFCVLTGCKILSTVSIKTEEMTASLDTSSLIIGWLPILGTHTDWKSHNCQTGTRQRSKNSDICILPTVAEEETESACRSLNINPVLWVRFLHSFIAFTLPRDGAQFESAQGVDYLFSDKTGFNLRV